MFCYQQNFACQCERVTAELFARLTVSDEVTTRIRGYRARLAERDALKAALQEQRTLLAANADPQLPMNRQLKDAIAEIMAKLRDIDSLKSGLPTLMYQVAQFDETLSKKGRPGRWRKQTAARLNGLFMLDIDHVDDPRALMQKWVDDYAADNEADLPADAVVQRAAFCHSMGIVLVHVTPSGRGLRAVAVADAATGNLADNQARLSSQLGVEPDKACKDASRCSFCPGIEDILFIDKEKLFDYEDKDYDEKFGPQYRGGNSKPSAHGADVAAQPDGAGAAGARLGADDAGRVAAPGAAGVEHGAGTEARDGLDRLEQLKREGYHGKSIDQIITEWFRQQYGGRPQVGSRHHSLFQLACDLRYVADSDARVLARLLAECEVGREVADERGAAELERLAADACQKPLYQHIPRRMQSVLQAVGVQLDDAQADAEARRTAQIDYGYWWKRLEPLLGDSPGYREAVATLPDEHKLAGVLAAGAMMGTYLTRCWWEHFDGKDYRLSFLVYIIGSAASGKSFVTQMDQLLMAPMLASDKVGREWERQYKEEMKKRSASTKNAKSEAPDQQHPVVRYLPSTVSNAMLYRRLTDALDANATGPDGEPMHLHCYTCEAELATALRVQTGSWAGKLDLECKSFQNEVAGVDYANDQSVNGIIQVNWNQVVTGTPDAMSRKIRPSTVLDGLVTRLCIFPMPQNDFAMIERRRAVRDHEREAFLRSIGIRLEQVKGELRAERLVDFCYDYECRLTDEARLEQDYCLDYFRKRIPLIMMRYTLVRIVMRELFAGESPSDDSSLFTLHSSLKVEDSDLAFARLIGDFCLTTQMYLFGQMVMDAMEAESKAFTPRRRSRKIREAYAMLPETIDAETLVVKGVAKTLKTASNTIGKWIEDGLISPVGNKKFKKNFKEIPE